MSDFLTKDFNTSSAAAWKQKIQFDLKGADYNKTLLTTTNEGITIKPFYHLDNFEKLKIPTPQEDFKICQKITISSEKEANLKATNAIKNGVNSIKFIINQSFNSKILFKNLLNKQLEFHFQFHFLDETFIGELFKLLKNETVYYNLDIVGNLAKTGNWFNSLTNDFNVIENLLQQNKKQFLLSVDVNIYQNAGANTVQQTAYALAQANEYLTKFGDDVAQKIQFNFAIGSNYFFEISKIRAFRYLYNLILGEYNTNSIAQIFAEPSLRNKTLYDAHVNMLRTTTESMSAILGGANTISNYSFDTLFHHPNEFGEQIAQNQLLIFKEESNFKNAQHIVTDTYYIETITKEIAEKALAIFKDIEKGGGFLHQLKEGTIQRKIAENAQKEQIKFNSGELVLVGSNKYLNEQENIKNNIEISPFIKRKPYKTLIIPISAKRLSETLEQKRLKNET